MSQKKNKSKKEISTNEEICTSEKSCLEENETSKNHIVSEEILSSENAPGKDVEDTETKAENTSNSDIDDSDASKEEPSDEKETKEEAKKRKKELKKEKKELKKQSRVRKIIKRILLAILILLLLVIGGLCIKYRNTLSLILDWDNIVSFFNSQWYSSKDLEDQIAQSDATMEKRIKEEGIDVRKPTAEEEKALANGEITGAQLTKIIQGKSTLKKEIDKNKKKQQPKQDKKPVKEEKPKQEQNPDDGANNGTSGNSAGNAGGNTSVPVSGEQSPQNPSTPAPKPQEKPPASQKPQDRKSEIVAELYVIQAEVISSIEQIGDRAYEDYKKTHYDRSKVMDIVDSYTAEVGELERQCDKKVAALIKELNGILDKEGSDRSFSNEIRDYYYQQKSLKKSYYLNKLNDEDYK